MTRNCNNCVPFFIQHLLLIDAIESGIQLCVSTLQHVLLEEKRCNEMSRNTLRMATNASSFY